MKRKKIVLTTAQTAAMMAILTVFAKVLGLLRELFLANYFGAGIVSDAYVMAQNIPNTLLASLVSSAAVAFMPSFSNKFETEGEDKANRFTSQMLNLVFCLCGAAILAGCLLATPLVRIFAPGFGAEATSLTVFFTRFAFVTVFFNAVITLLEAYLQYRGVFIPQIILGYFQNISVVAFIIIGSLIDPHLLIFGTVAGFGIRMVCSILLARTKGFRYYPDFHAGKDVKDAVLLAVPVFIGGAANQINMLIDKMLASNLREGSVSSLNYASLLVNSIIALTVTVMVTIIYPRFNKAFAQNDMERIGSIASRSLNLILLFSIPLTAGAMVYSKMIIHIVYERGEFDSAATSLTSAAFLFYAISLCFAGLSQMMTKMFYSLHNTKVTVRITFVAVAVNIGLNLILVKYMQNAGLALATSAAQATATVLLYIAARRQYPLMRLAISWRKVLKILVFTAVSVGASYAAFTFLSGKALPGIVCLAAAAVSAAVIYLILLRISGFEELGLIRDLFARNRTTEENR